MLKPKKKNWPHSFGFKLHGKGPCYIVEVTRGSMAEKAGLRSGDQLLEINGQDVTTLSARDIKEFGKSRSTNQPELEVVSCLQSLVLALTHPAGCGFKVSNKSPVTVLSVQFGSPAYLAGLRVGDIILEVNQLPATGIKTFKTVLTARPDRLMLLIIPVGRTSNLIQADRILSQISGPDPRLFRAQDLHHKLESLFGNDHTAKSAIISSLKRYAEDRDIMILCSALSEVLTSPLTRQILRDIRLLIPPDQRSVFDELVDVGRTKITHFSSHEPRAEHRIGQRKLVQVMREADSFGFVIRSSSPAFIESVDPGGAADKAGLLPGDYLIKLNGLDIRRYDHDRLVVLLQESGSAPTLEVLRYTEGTTGGSRVSFSSSSSVSSHGSLDNILCSETFVDSEGNSFTDKAAFLLTPREWNTLKKIIKAYSLNRDIIVLYSSMSNVLDTPSKQTLWAFLFVMLSPPHREYVSHHIGSSPTAVTSKGITLNTPVIASGGDNSTEDTVDVGEFPPSFTEHLHFLLTHGEMLQFIKILKVYDGNKDVNTLMDSLGDILDTTSKKTLWRQVLPYLSDEHRQVVRDKFHLPDYSSDLASLDSYIGFPDNDSQEVAVAASAANKDDDILYGESQNHGIESSSEDGNSTDTSTSPVQSRKHSSQKTVYTTGGQESISHVSSRESEDREAGSHIEDSSELESAHPYVTIIPVAGSKPQPRRLRFQESSQIFFGKRRITMDTGETERVAERFNFLGADNSSDSDDEEGDTEGDGRNSGATWVGRQSESLQQAFQQLDDVLSLESSDELSSLKSETFDTKHNSAESTQEVGASHGLSPPPAPPLANLTHTFQEKAGRLSVRHINWDKMDNSSVQNTVWDKVNGQLPGDVLQFLDLDTQFSATANQHKNIEKRKEVLIMDQRKAYNISILLGHLKMSVHDVTRAMYEMDDSILSPDLIGQLLAFIPNEFEMSQYRQYKDDISLLSQADQFAYQISLVPNYEERLKALKLKVIFSERVKEITSSLWTIQSASQESRSSKKLALLLEVILVIGNYMNRGNPRVGEAAGFKITFLSQLDTTKTTDKKSSFLHVVAEAAYKMSPEILSVAEDLQSVSRAAKVSLQAVVQELENLMAAVEEIKSLLARTNQSTPNDQFLEVMTLFTDQATEEIHSMSSLQAKASDEFSKTVTYFGEDENTRNTSNLFGILSEFIHKLQKAHAENLLNKRQ